MGCICDEPIFFIERDLLELAVLALIDPLLERE
jgi:hypothetical protein